MRARFCPLLRRGCGLPPPPLPLWLWRPLRCCAFRIAGALVRRSGVADPPPLDPAAGAAVYKGEGRGQPRAPEGNGWRSPRRWPQRRLGRRLEEVAKAVGGGYCRLQMPLRLAPDVRHMCPKRSAAEPCSCSACMIRTLPNTGWSHHKGPVDGVCGMPRFAYDWWGGEDEGEEGCQGGGGQGNIGTSISKINPSSYPSAFSSCQAVGPVARPFQGVFWWTCFFCFVFLSNLRRLPSNRRRLPFMCA